MPVLLQSKIISVICDRKNTDFDSRQKVYINVIFFNDLSY